MTKDISVSFLTNHFVDVQRWLERNYVIRVLNSKSKTVITTMYPGESKPKTTPKLIITIDDIDNANLIPINQDSNLYEILSQDPSQYNQEPVYRFATHR